MSDNTRVIQGINWRQVFPFTHIFRSFRVAIHPSKMILAMLAMICLYLGGRFFDAFWPMSQRALPMEIETYRRCPSNKVFLEQREKDREENNRKYAQLIREVKPFKPGQMENMEKQAESLEAAKEFHYIPEVRYYIRDTYINNEVTEAKNALKNKKEAKPADIALWEKEYNEKVAGIYADAREKLQILNDYQGVKPFQAFFHYEAACMSDIINSVLSCNILGGMSNPDERPGVVRALVNFVTVAPSWALRNHTLYFFLYGAYFLCVWSLFGGAISRIAAVQFADEGKKLSLRQGLDFSIHKFLSFVSAPLIPALIVLIIGIAIALVPLLLMNIPGVSIIGQILVGAALILALIGGLVITLVIIGMAGGFNLMYPTISIEGSDSFDAISRSFSYVYARPWRMLLNTLVGVIYGSICFLFIRTVIWLILLTTHFFVGLLVFKTLEDGTNLLNAIWPTPSFGSFSSAADPIFADRSLRLASFFFHFWTYLFVSVLGAFVISFYFSMNTIIYYLLRKEVDSTEMDDVYWEEPEEEFIDKTPGGASSAAYNPEDSSPIASVPPPAEDAPNPEPPPPPPEDGPPEPPTQST